MFQPQPTPYFSSYGVATSLPDFSGFQPTGGGGGGGGVVDSGGPTAFRDRIFSPVAINGPSPLNFTHGHSQDHNNINSALPHNYLKMNGNDIDAQEALARDYNPTLGVREIEIRCEN